MGFGVLLIGYFLNLSIFKQFTDVICFLIMLYALTMLSRFNSGFRRAMYFCIPLVLAGAAYFAYETCVMLGVVYLPTESANIITSYYSLLTGILKLIFTSYLLVGIQAIGKETGVPVIEMKAARNRFLSYIYYVLFIFTELSFEEGSKLEMIAIYAFLPVLIFGVVYHIMNLALIHSCYVWICLEGDEDMERKKSRFAFINKINEKQDKLADRLVEQKREQKLQKAKKKNNK